MFKFPLTFLKRFNKNNSTKILTNKTIIDKPINYNGSSILYKALGFQCLGYNVHGIVHNNFNNINRFYTQSKVFNDLHKNSNTSSSIKEIPTTTTTNEEDSCKENVKMPREYHKDYFNIALNSCGVSKLDDVYNISYDDFVKTTQARSLVNYYGRSIIKICYSLFPNHNWVPWLFRQNNDLSSKRKQPDYNYHDEINWYASINNITESNLDQWYNVSLDEFRKVFDSQIKKFNIALNSCGGSELDDEISLDEFRSECQMGSSVSSKELKSFIQKAYPHHNFDTNKFRIKKYKEYEEV
ncbi:hypothetical protein ACTFIR_007170 [Dictyostelium discoideum]